ncbi:MAG: histidine kinase, partial [Curvibacter sp.]
MTLWRALALCCGLLGLLAPVRAELLELRQAHVSTMRDGVLREGEIRLPYNWDRQHQWRSGRAEFEIPLRLDRPPSEPYAIYFDRVGNRAEIWLNGVLLSRFGDLARDNSEDYAKAPQYVLIPAQLLQRENLFRIILHADGGRRGGLSSVLVGPEAEVREHYHAAYRWLVHGSVAVSVFSLVVGVIALLLWATQVEHQPGARPRRDMLYLSAGVAEVCWMLRLSDTALTDPPLAWPWWGVLQTLAYAGWFCGSALFCHYVAGWHRHASMRWVRLMVWALLLTAVPAAWLALSRHNDVYLTGWYGFATFLFIGYAAVYFWGALR